MRGEITAPRARLAPANPVLAAVAGAALTFAMAYRLAGGHRHLIEAVVAIAGVALVFRWPRQLFYVWVAVTATILPSRVVPFSVGGIRSDLPEAVSLAILALVVVRWAMGDAELRRPEMAAPFLVLFAGACVGVVVSSSYGDGRSVWLASWKALAMFLLPLAVTALHRTGAQVEALERWVVRIAVVGSVLAFATFFTGFNPLTKSTTQVVTLGVTSDANRLRPAVLNLLMLATLLVIAKCAREGVNWKRLAALLLFASLIAMSFTRSTWVPLIVAIALFVIGRPGRRVPLRALRAAVLIFAIAALAFGAAASGALGPSMKAVTARVESVGNPQVFQENSYQDRANEDTIAWATLQGHLLQGNGLGRPYGDVVIEHDPITGQTVREPRQFIQNSYLGTWLGLGVIGLLAWAWLSVAITRRALRARRDPTANGIRSFAAACALLGLGLQAIFQTSLYNRSVLATVTCAVALLVGPSRSASEQP
ncbi:MAG TPA: O-antigen ligase family protein [Mycobacteriales bacterium]|nr:O-antigen ligase family protein [Mycobacteriales bacterium]